MVDRTEMVVLEAGRGSKGQRVSSARDHTSLSNEKVLCGSESTDRSTEDDKVMSRKCERTTRKKRRGARIGVKNPLGQDPERITKASHRRE